MVTGMTDNKFRDSSGRVFADYPRPSVAVDIAPLTPHPDEGLLVLEVRRDVTAGWALPGTFLWEGSAWPTLSSVGFVSRQALKV